MKRSHILKTTAQNCVNCKYLEYIYEKDKTITEMEQEYPEMDHYSAGHAYRCTSSQITDEDTRQQIIAHSYAGKKIICYRHSSIVKDQNNLP